MTLNPKNFENLNERQLGSANYAEFKIKDAQSVLSSFRPSIEEIIAALNDLEEYCRRRPEFENCEHLVWYETVWETEEDLLSNNQRKQIATNYIKYLSYSLESGIPPYEKVMNAMTYFLAPDSFNLEVTFFSTEEVVFLWGAWIEKEIGVPVNWAEEEILLCFAKCYNSTPELLSNIFELLKTNPDDEVYAAIAQNPNTPENILDCLTESATYLYQIYNNPKISIGQARRIYRIDTSSIDSNN